MAELSYSFHVSNNKNAIKTASDLGRADSHNARNYSNYDKWKQEQKINNTYTKADNVFLIGGENLYKDVQEMYKKEFGEALKDYNAKQKRDNRKIKDYFNHISKSETQHVATEIIVQVGSKENWKNLDLLERQKMTPVFRGQVQEFQQRNPNFKICQAVIHYDESSPHLHIVGVPVGEGKKRGLARKVQKSAVFSQKSLFEMQNYMRDRAERDCKQYLSPYISFKDKQMGRNKDYRKEELKSLDDSITMAEERLKIVENQYQELYKILAVEKRKRQKIQSLKPAGIKLEEDNFLDRIAKKIYKQNNAKVNPRELYNFVKGSNEIEKVNAGLIENLKSLKADINNLQREKDNLENQLKDLEKQDLAKEIKSRDMLEKSVRQELADKIEAVEQENEYIKSVYRPEVMDQFVKENKSLKEENRTLKSQNKELMESLTIAKDEQKELKRQLKKYKNKSKKDREDDFFR